MVLMPWGGEGGGQQVSWLVGAPSRLLCRRTRLPAHRMVWRVWRKWCKEDMGSGGVVRFLPDVWPRLNSGQMKGANRRCVLICRPARGRTCCRHTHGFNEGGWGSLKPVACGEEACSAGPAASGALLAGAPVQCLRYERSRPCQSNHSFQSFFVWV